MNAIRPLIIVRPDSDFAQLTAAVRAAVACRTAEGLIVLDVPPKGRPGASEFRSPSGADTAASGESGRAFTDGLQQLGMRFRTEVSRELNRSRIMKLADQFRSDLIITERQPNLPGRFLSYLSEDVSLLTDCRVPVWLCGRCAEPDAPIVAAIDPAPETEAAVESNLRVVRTAFSLASKYTPKKKIHFIALCEADSGLLTSMPERPDMKAMNDLRVEIFRTWANYSQRLTSDGNGRSSGTGSCVPVRISMHRGSTELLAMTLDEIQPKVIVTGKPLRSAMRRFFRPGVLPTFATGDLSVLSVSEQWLAGGRTESAVVGRENPAANVHTDRISHREIAC